MRKVISFSELHPFCYFHNRTVFENGSLHLSFADSPSVFPETEHVSALTTINRKITIRAMLP